MKTALRDRLRKERGALSPKWILSQSKKIEKKLVSECEKKNAIMLYASFDGEVDTHEIIKELLKRKKIVLLPKVGKKGIMPVNVKRFNELKPRRYGILEPIGTRAHPANKIDCIVVPGICFDENGHRIGFGAGFYDRFLSNVKCKKIGLAFDFQIVKKIPPHPHDIPVDVIITENRVIYCNRKVYKSRKRC
ncbi:MAG TPA: 5-formyltetrahydrofolate cyclo-ligase [Candidatus Nanoarchaeia archaeon]|nr:5-formyltetrahydrofolate cyclo-ligase [Candidatus Nanoarchaeia archaeon]